jgi:single-strand DNA-binding protein
MRKAFLTGNIGKDPEVFSPDGSEYSCLKFSIANNEESRKVGEEWENITSWFDCEYWTKKPTEWLNRLVKGKSIAIEARVKQQTWEQDGNNRSRVLFIVEGFPHEGQTRVSGNNTPASNAPAGNNNYEDPNIPF